MQCFKESDLLDTFMMLNIDTATLSAPESRETLDNFQQRQESLREVCTLQPVLKPPNETPAPLKKKNQPEGCEEPKWNNP